MQARSCSNVDQNVPNGLRQPRQGDGGGGRQKTVVKILGRGCPVESQLPYIDLVDRGIGNIINFKRGPVGNLVWLMSKVTKMTRGSAIREELEAISLLPITDQVNESIGTSKTTKVVKKGVCTFSLHNLVVGRGCRTGPCRSPSSVSPPSLCRLSGVRQTAIQVTIQVAIPR